MDRFDDIWKNRFNEEEFPVGDWNTPDEMIWNGITKEIAPKKDKRRLLWFWLSVGLILILLLSAILLGGSKSSSEVISEKEYGTLISEGSNNSNGIVRLDRDDITAGDAVNNANAESQRQNIVVNISPTENFDKPNVGNIGSVDNSAKLAKRRAAISNSTFKSPVPNFHQEGMIAEIQSKEIAGIESVKLNLLSSDQLIANSLSTKLAMLMSNEVAPLSTDVEPVTIFNEEKKATGKFVFGVQSGAVHWVHRISNTYTSDLDPFDFNYKNTWGWQTNLNLNFSINERFDLFTGLQYERVVTQSGHNSILSYDVASEPDPSNPLNAYALSLATPYGFADANFNFNRTQDVSSDIVDLGVDFHSQHLIQNLSLPVGATFYPVGRNNKLMPTVSAGLGINYLVSIRNDIDRIETHHDAIQYDDSGSSNFVQPDVNQFHLDYRVGAGLNYSTNRGWNLQINYNWARGINPIFQQDNYDTRIDRHHLSLGILKLIN
ncbi:MAG: hypothetical protein AAF573_08720 [Bacteroidota bacterium]